MIASVHAGSSSKNPSQAVFHWPAAFIPSQTGVAAGSFGAGFTPAAFASSNRMGAPRLAVWIDSRDPILRIIRISSRVAPASSAPRMWRRVPPALKFVMAAFTARLISSMSLRGRMPLVHGSSDIFETLAGPDRIPFAKRGQRSVVPRTSVLRVIACRCPACLHIGRHSSSTSWIRFRPTRVLRSAAATKRDARRRVRSSQLRRRQRRRRRHAVRHRVRVGDLVLDALLAVGLPDHEATIVIPAIRRHAEVLQRLVHAVDHTPIFMILRASSAVAILRPNRSLSSTAALIWSIDVMR